jgi:hypothetical protein
MEREWIADRSAVSRDPTAPSAGTTVRIFGATLTRQSGLLGGAESSELSIFSTCQIDKRPVDDCVRVIATSHNCQNNMIKSHFPRKSYDKLLNVTLQNRLEQSRAI